MENENGYSKKVQNTLMIMFLLGIFIEGVYMRKPGNLYCSLRVHRQSVSRASVSSRGLLFSLLPSPVSLPLSLPPSSIRLILMSI